MKTKPFPQLQSHRIQLRALVSTDAEAVLFLRSNSDVNRFITRPIPKTVLDASAFIEKIQANISAGSTVYWSICLVDQLDMIGAISLRRFSNDNTYAEIGYELHPKHQNQGIMSESIALVLDYGFQVMKLEEIEAFTHHSNEASKALLDKLGFVLQKGKEDADNLDNVIYKIENTRR